MEKKRWPRLLVVVLLVVFSAILLSGIYGKWGISRNGKKITIGVFAGSYWDIENGYYYRILDDAIARFRQEHPDYEVEYASGIRKSDYTEWLSDQIMEGRAPDIFFVPRDDLDTFGQIGALHPLDDLIREDSSFDENAFYPAAFRCGQREERQLALPYECAPNMMFVNKSILDKEGISLPDSDWTWDELLTICRKVTHSTDDTGIINQFGVSGFTWEDAFDANGVELFREDGSSCDFTADEVGEALSFLERLREANEGYPASGSDFSSGNVAFQPMRFSEYRAYKSRELSLKKYSGFEWDCITMPAGPSGDNSSSLDTLCVGMSSKTSHEKEAWEMIKILTCEKEIQKEIFDYSEGISPLCQVTESSETEDRIRRETGSRMNMETIRRAMDKAIVRRRFSGYEEAHEQVSLAVRSILEGSANLQMEQIIWNRTINNYLKTRQ